MIPLTLDEVRRICPGSLQTAPGAERITGVRIDSRHVEPGDLFVAVGGGAPFRGEAMARGAAATLLPADPHRALAALGSAVRERSSARFVGITGSTGKTSTKDILAAICAPRARTVASERSFNAELGVPLTLCRVEPDTAICILELAMRGPGQIAALCEIARPELGAITNLGPAHLALVGDLAGVVRAKGELIRALPPGGTAVVPADAAGLPEREDLRYRRFSPADLLAFAADGDGSRALLDIGGERVEIRFGFTARHQALNALVALHLAAALGFPPGEVRVLDVEFSAWRGDEVPLPGGGLLINDSWNANPISMRAALEHLAARAGGRRRVAVLGDMAELGEQGPRYHRELRDVIWAARVDALYAFGELAEHYLGGGPERECWSSELDHHGLIELLREELEPGDCVLIKGSRAMRLDLVADALTAVEV